MIQSIKHHLNSTGIAVCRFLQDRLPVIGGEGWWNTHVLSQLTYGQQGQVRTRNITTLGGLDIAALLRVFERNWAELSYDSALPNELRTHIRELADLRNAISHHATDGAEMLVGDAFRYLDTIGRVLKALGTDPTAVEAVECTKRDAMRAMAGEFIPAPQIVEIPAQMKAVREEIREVQVMPTADAIPTTAEDECTATIQVGAFRLLGPGDSIATEIASFGGLTVPATAIPWKVIGPNGLEFIMHVVLIDEGADAEFGQVFCESRLGSPQNWDDIVRRLRMGIRRLDDGELIMDLRCAVRPNGARATRNVKTLAEFDTIVGINVASTLKSIGATTVGTRAEIANETNKNRNVPAVSFAADDLVTPAAAWVLATLRCLI